MQPPYAPDGFPGTSLIVLRGDSAAGKTTVAGLVREAYGRGCALVELDYLRRIVLGERDAPGAAAPALVSQTARSASTRGYHVVCEGIMPAARYGPVLEELVADHLGRTSVWYLDVAFAESVRRHGTRRSPSTVEDLRVVPPPGSARPAGRGAHPRALHAHSDSGAGHRPAACPDGRRPPRPDNLTLGWARS